MKRDRYVNEDVCAFVYSSNWKKNNRRDWKKNKLVFKRRRRLSVDEYKKSYQWRRQSEFDAEKKRLPRQRKEAARLPPLELTT